MVADHLILEFKANVMDGLAEAPRPHHVSRLTQPVSKHPILCLASRPSNMIMSCPEQGFLKSLKFELFFYL